MNLQKPLKKKRSLRNYTRFSGIAFQMMAIIGGGTYSGVYLDKKFPNKHGIYTIILSLASVLIALYFVIRQIIKMSNRESS